MKNKIFLAAAHTQGAPLPALVEELRAIEKVLQPLQERNLFELESNRAANIDDIFNAFSQSKNIQIFHYAGHAEGDKLYLEEDGDIKGITELFGLNKAKGGEWSTLQFVFINGCSSKGQVDSFHQAGVGAVIATSRPIDDTAARLLSEQFYKTWVQEGKSIKEAFETAKARVHTDPANATRSIVLSDEELPEGEYSDEIPWGLYFHPDLKDQDGEYWVLNKKISEAMDLSEVKTNANQNLIAIAQQFKESDPDAKEQVDKKGKDELMVLIERLPWIISTHLRRLFAVNIDVSENDVDEEKAKTKRRIRLRELITAYSELTRFINYITLSLLWDAKSLLPDAKTVALPFPVIPAEDTFATTNFVYRTTVYLEQLKQLNAEERDGSGLIKHISKFIEELNGETKLNKAYQLMEEWKQALAGGEERFEELIQSRAGGESEKEAQLVQMAEAIYAKFLSSVLFFTKYKLHTVRSIVVDKVRSLSDATPYSHHTMSLHAAFGDLETLLTEREAATDNYCLLLAPLVKNGDTLADAVNLSPFYLDRSSFIGNSSGNYPALFAMDFKRVKESDFFDDEEEYVFHYIDKDINHDYAFAKDLELVINKVGAELPDHIEDRQKLSKSFIKVFQQIEQLNKDFPHNTQAD